MDIDITTTTPARCSGWISAPAALAYRGEVSKPAHRAVATSVPAMSTGGLRLRGGSTLHPSFPSSGTPTSSPPVPA